MTESVCAHALLDQGVFEVSDLSVDPRFDHNKLVHGAPYARFYAGAPLRTPDGLPLGTVCVLDLKPRTLTKEQRDVLVALARQVMAQLELRRSLQLADRLQRNVSRMMAVVGHDLKQPLQVMVMAIERVRRKLGDPSDRQRMELAIGAGMRIAEELDRLAETSVMQGGGMPVAVSFPIEELFKSIASTWQVHAEAKGLKLTIKPCAGRVVSDVAMLRAIVGNLVGNAIKYTSSGRVLVGCRKRGNSLSIEVLDTGEGIAAEQIGTIFDAFRQINPASDGLGLGLSIVRRTAEALGHSIEVKSDLKRGTHFRVLVPLAA
jgi:signal transduction histidine kinase